MLEYQVVLERQLKPLRVENGKGLVPCGFVPRVTKSFGYDLPNDPVLSSLLQFKAGFPHGRGLQTCLYH